MTKISLSSGDSASLMAFAKKMAESLDDGFHGAVYDVLVAHAGASPAWKDDFVVSCRTTTEYRFQGLFGFGGKYWPKRNRVTYYPEDQTPERDALQDHVNAELAAVWFKHGCAIPMP